MQIKVQKGEEGVGLVVEGPCSCPWSTAAPSKSPLLLHSAKTFTQTSSSPPLSLSSSFLLMRSTCILQGTMVQHKQQGTLLDFETNMNSPEGDGYEKQGSIVCQSNLPPNIGCGWGSQAKPNPTHQLDSAILRALLHFQTSSTF